jgi:hypothetical protein
VDYPRKINLLNGGWGGTPPSKRIQWVGVANPRKLPL